MPAPDRARLLKTVHAYVEEFNKFTPESCLMYRKPTASHQFRPASMEGNTVMDRDALTANLNRFRTVVPDFKWHIQHDETIVDVEQRRVMLYLKCTGTTAIGIYENEYVWTGQLSEDGTEIEKSAEFMDSDYASTFMAKLGLIERPDPLRSLRRK